PYPIECDARVHHLICIHGDCLSTIWTNTQVEQPCIIRSSRSGGIVCFWILAGALISDFSVQPLCSLCLCGCCIVHSYNHRDTENTEVAQRSPKLGTTNTLNALDTRANPNKIRTFVFIWMPKLSPSAIEKNKNRIEEAARKL